MKLETKYEGAIKLAAIEDVLDWIIGFERNSDILKSKYGTAHVSNFYDWEKKVGGRFNGYIDRLKEGSYPDDTQPMLSVARSITGNNAIDREHFSKVGLPSWTLYVRGAGRTIRSAARKIEWKSAKWNNNFFTYKTGTIMINYRESGVNGAAMRILPIALANFGDIDKVKKKISANSIVTYGHPRAIIGATLYGYVAHTILKFPPEHFPYKTYLAELGKNVHRKLSTPFIKKHGFDSWENEWSSEAQISFTDQYQIVLDEIQQYLRNIYKCLNYNIGDGTALRILGCYNLDTKGSGTPIVIAGIFLCRKYHSELIRGIK